MEPVAILGALIYTVVEFIKNVLGRDWERARTQALVWATGIAVMLIASQSTIAGGVEVAGVKLGTANVFDLVLIGMQASSLFSTARSLTRNFGVNARPTVNALTTNHPSGGTVRS